MIPPAPPPAKKLEDILPTDGYEEKIPPIRLDDVDELRIENVMLKEKLEELRIRLNKSMLKQERENLHDYFVDKYDIDIATQKFVIENGKLVIVSK